MADLSDVESGLVAAVAAALYPDGAGSPSVVGADCRIYRGWPNAPALDADLAAGKVNISVFSKPGMTKLTTRFQAAWRDLPRVDCGISVAVAGDTATFSGTAATAGNAGIRCRAATYVVPLTPGLTAEQVAAALAALAPGATAAGPAVTLPPSPDLIARTMGMATAIREVRREEQGVVVTVWASTPAQRDAAASAIDLALAPVAFLPLADGTSARLKYSGTMVNDAPSKDRLWRRDLDYLLEYPTVQKQSFPRQLFGVDSITATQAGPTATIIA